MSQKINYLLTKYIKCHGWWGEKLDTHPMYIGYMVATVEQF